MGFMFFTFCSSHLDVFAERYWLFGTIYSTRICGYVWTIDSLLRIIHSGILPLLVPTSVQSLQVNLSLDHLIFFFLGHLLADKKKETITNLQICWIS